MAPLVSILIPAYNAERWIAETIQSALAQTWPRTEVIVVNDGSRDRTLAVAHQFTTPNVSVVTQQNQGASAARNKAFELCQGDYIQWLDADDLLAPDKIARQMEAAREADNTRALISSAWAYFIYSRNRASFVPTPIWCDLAPVEWLTRKMGQNLHMPPATWLVTRELTQAAGPWDTQLSFDDDGEYFCRVVLASNAIRFVPEARTFYRMSGPGSVSDFDQSKEKLASLFLSMQLHVSYLRALEESERTRAACLNYLQRRFFRFYPEQTRLLEQLQKLATTLGGRLEIPQLPWKYSLMQKLLGWTLTKRVRQHYRRWRLFVVRFWDKALFYFEGRETARRLKAIDANSSVSSRDELIIPRPDP
jgi:glycosyltransferase involved in cell wall biosynthesis